MKHTLLALGAAAALGLFTLLLVPGLHRATAGSLGEEARLAIDVRCGEADGGAARACRTRLERLYAAGALEPDRTLRAYCETRRTAPWGGSPRQIPQVCLDRYGGW